MTAGRPAREDATLVASTMPTASSSTPRDEDVAAARARIMRAVPDVAARREVLAALGLEDAVSDG